MKAYWIAKVNVDDKKAYAEYAKRVTPALAKYNGKFLEYERRLQSRPKKYTCRST